MKKFEEPKMELIAIEALITWEGTGSDDETVAGGGGFGPIIKQ